MHQYHPQALERGQGLRERAGHMAPVTHPDLVQQAIDAHIAQLR